MYDSFSLLQSLKDKKFSRIVNNIRYRILTALQQDYFSPTLKPYFPTIERQVRELEALRPIYLALQRTDLSFDERTCQLNRLKAQLAPFADFDIEPAQITQVKKILNALYHTEMALLDVEGLALDGDFSFSYVFNQAGDVNTLYTHTMEQVYHATYLMTHVDVDLRGVFAHEWSLLSPLFQVLDQFVRTETQRAMGFAYGYHLTPWAETAAIEPGQLQVKIEGDLVIYRVIHPQGMIITGEIHATELKDDLNQPLTVSQLNLCFSKLLEITSRRGDIELKSYNQKQVAHTTGLYSGLLIDQLKPGAGADYQFLTQFTAEIPRYLGDWSTQIQMYSELASAGEPSHLDPHQLEALRNHALVLLHAIENLQNGTFFFSVKLLNYIRIIRQVVTLALSILEEANHLNETAQSAICAKMNTLKYFLSGELLAATDKIEEAMMLKPGFLSNHLKRHLQNFYNILVHYINKYVDFSKRQPDLLTLDDEKFHAIRMERAHRRTSKIKVELLRIEEVKCGLNAFFTFLKQPRFKGMRLKDLPHSAKQELIKNYRLIQPYVNQTDLVDVDLVASLTSDPTYLMDPRRLISWIIEYNDSVSFILRSESQLLSLIEKEQNTIRFQLSLNQELIQSIMTSSRSSKLTPCKTQDRFYLIDEARVLGIEENPVLEFEGQGGHKLLSNPEQLSSTQTRRLYRFYSMYQAKLVGAMSAYETFSGIFRQYPADQTIQTLPEQEKQTLQNLFAVFQPYWFHLFTAGQDGFLLDKLMVSALSTHADDLSKTVTVSDFFQVQSEFFQGITRHLSLVREKQMQLARIHKEVFVRELDVKPLIAIKRHERAHYVIGHTEYSKAFREFKANLEKFTRIFNDAVQRELKPAPEGVPFPELGVSTGGYSQSSQVLMLKRLINSAYHLEQLFTHLETLHDQSTQIVYVMKIGRASVHVYNLLLLTNALFVDPYTVQMAGDILEKLKYMQGHVMTLLRPYLLGIPALNEEEPEAFELESLPDSPGSYASAMGSLEIQIVSEGGAYREQRSRSSSSSVQSLDLPPTVEVNQTILHVLNAMMVLPEHIKSARQGQRLEKAKITQSHADAYTIAQDIQRIIQHSGSYFKLFLETPRMYELLNDLSVKFEIVTTATHDAVVDNLQHIRNELIPKLLLEADHWEDKFALLPGTISQPLRDMLDAYFIGLIESLELPTQQHLALVQSMIPLDIELEDASIQKASIGFELECVREKEAVLQRFSKQVQLFKETKNEPNAKAATISNLAEALATDFNHFIVPLREKVTLPISLEELSLTSLSTSESGAQDNLMTSTEEILKVCASHYHGLNASHQLAIDTIEEKILFLQRVKASKEIQDRKYIFDYTTKLFNEQSLLLSSRQFGLIHSEVEYRGELFHYLKSYESEIVQQAIEARDHLDIRNNIIELLSEKIRGFERRHYEDYKQLSDIKAAIEQFRIYIDHANSAMRSTKRSLTPLFENEKTLREKNALLLELKDIACNQKNEQNLEPEFKLSVKDRVKKIKSIVERSDFPTTMLRYHSFNAFSFNWLKQLVVSLLKLVGLYTPIYQKRFKDLKRAVLEKPDLNQMGSRYGLFSVIPHTNISPAEVKDIEPSIPIAITSAP
ncbi:hypothetical protein [Legionella impletisoli]|uniref:Protein SdhA n=1 Tax=Legionella impletisoli TaxID=343510 RepID=A0A917JV00_9GAMM|nr:hypothetical protein [Legionella impletisoli]GGI86295.1 protein SdhA [Legionella impletisoli]